MAKAFSCIGALATLFFAWNTVMDISGTVAGPGAAATLHGMDPGNAAMNYANYCASCHGEKMEAFVDRKWKHGDTREDLFRAIKLGYADEGMPGFDTTFTDAETYELADYMLTGIENLKRYDFKKEPEKVNFFPSRDIDIRLDTIVKDIHIAWGMAFLPGGDMLFTEKSGKVYRVGKNRQIQAISGAPSVLDEGQGGLMDIALHPDFRKNNTLYLSYSAFKQTGEGTLSTTAIMRAVLKGSQLTQQQVIFEALPYARTRHHYGCRLAFGRDGYLYFSVGDRGNHNEHPQSLQNHCGKIHRIKDDGSIPGDNPFVNTPGAMASIYSYGHRNPQGIALNPFTGTIWTHEHGPRGGDEVNIISKGKNYGWPVISYGINYNGVPITSKTAMDGMEQPDLYWIPSIAPCGMTFVKGDRYPAWKGDMLAASLRYGYLNRCITDGDKIKGEEILLKNIGRMRDVQQSPDGWLYVSVEKGYIFRLVPVSR